MLLVHEQYYDFYIRRVHLQYALCVLRRVLCTHEMLCQPHLCGIRILLYAHIATTDSSRFYELGNLFFQALTYGTLMQHSNVYRVRIAERMSIVRVTDAVVTYYHISEQHIEYVLLRLFGLIAWKQVFFFFDGEYTQTQQRYFVDASIMYAPNLSFICGTTDASMHYMQPNSFAINAAHLPIGVLYCGGKFMRKHASGTAALTTWGMYIQNTVEVRVQHYTYLKEHVPRLYLMYLLGLGQFEDDDTFRLYHAVLTRMPFSMEIRPDVGVLNGWYARIVQSFYVFPVV